MKSPTFNTIFKQFNNKGLLSNLKKIQGVNFKSHKKIALLNGINLNTKGPINSSDVVAKITNQAQHFFNLEKNKIFLNIEKKKRVKSYQGMRHLLRLPVRGQRTHTNAKTPKSNIKKEI
jgi:small subunit ribosomal protein S13